VLRGFISEAAAGWFGDNKLFLAVLLLSLFGVAMVYSAGQLDIPDSRVAGVWRMQLVWLGISLFALLVTMSVPTRWIEWVAWPGYLIGLGLLVATLAFGTGGHGVSAGVRRWIQIGPFLLQPAQFANLATIILLARIVGRWKTLPESLFALWLPVVVTIVPMGLVMMQPDLGTAIVFGAILLAVLYWGGTPVPLLAFALSPALGLLVAFEPWLFSMYMVVLIGALYFYRGEIWTRVTVLAANLAAGTIALPLWNSLAPYQQARLLVFLDPTLDPQGTGYHVLQSRIAIGSGGLFGKGFTLGTQKRLAFLPEQHTDFIYSVVGEELGFLGAILVLLLLGYVLLRLVRIAERVPDTFAGLVVFGIFGAWFTHVVINVGMTVGVMPVTGLPLPFISYGGSFLVASFIAVGIAQRIAARQTVG
jgi:rod shape determining protein RodA